MKNSTYILYIIGVMAVLMFLSVASAWSSTTFNDSQASATLNFTGNQNITRWLAVPNTVSALTTAYFNLTGFVGGANIFNNSMVAYWNLDQSSDPVIDLVAGLNNGTNVNAIPSIPGILNNSYTFGNDTQFINVGNDNIDLIGQNMTINAWINILEVPSAEVYTILGANVSNGWGFYLEVPSGNVTLGKFGVNEIVSDINIPTSVWRMVTLVYNASGANFFVNGTYSITKTYSSTFTAGLNYQIGGRPAGAFNGSIDEVGVWNRSLTPAEINDLYNSGAGLTYGITPNTTLTIGDDLIHIDIEANGTTPITRTITNLTSTINTYLTASYLIGSNYLIPFIFHSDNSGNLTYDAMFFSNANFTENSQTFNTTSIETARETFILNVNYDSLEYTSSSAVLIYNGTSYTSTRTGTGAGTLFTRAFDLPAEETGGNRPFYWTVTLTNSSGANLFNSSTNNQNVRELNGSLCSAGEIPYINFTFQNETVAQESITALISESSWDIWLGGGDERVNFTYSNAGEESSYAFCMFPQDQTVNTDVFLSYDNADSQQRTYNPAAQALTNTTTNRTLWLLPTADGIFVTFQVINTAEQPLSNVTLTISRSGFGTISETTTGASGTSTIFLNPNFVYTLTASRTGFTDFTITQVFSLTEYTITLQGAAALADDYTRGIVITVLPAPGTTLTNNTVYNFNATLASSFWDISSFGYVLYNETGGVLTSASTGGVGTVSANVDTVDNDMIYMDVFWVTNNTYNNATYYWTIDEGDRTGTIAGFFSRLRSYTSDGLYGLTAFNLALLGFIALFMFMGVMASKFGIVGVGTQNIAILAGTVLTWLFFFMGVFTSVLIPTTATIFSIVILIREGSRG